MKKRTAMSAFFMCILNMNLMRLRIDNCVKIEILLNSLDMLINDSTSHHRVKRAIARP